MTDWYLPTHMEYVRALPRNNTGEIRKELLRRHERDATEGTNEQN